VAEYVAALCIMRKGYPQPYEATRFVAQDPAEAKEKAKEWAAMFDFVANDALLHVTLDGRGILTLKREEFDAPRRPAKAAALTRHRSPWACRVALRRVGL